MLANKFLVLVSLVCLAVLAIAQTPPPTLPPRSLPKIGMGPRVGKRPAIERRTFFVGGKQFRSILNGPGPSSDAGWTSASPLPIGLAKAEEIARAQLRTFVTDESAWQVSDFHIGRFADQPNWYFSVTLEPAVQVVGGGLPPDSFTVLLDFAGTPGKIWRVESQN